MRRTVVSFGTAFVVLISSTKGPSKITLKRLAMAMELMGSTDSKKKMSPLQKSNKMMIDMGNRSSWLRSRVCILSASKVVFVFVFRHICVDYET